MATYKDPSTDSAKLKRGVNSEEVSSVGMSYRNMLGLSYQKGSLGSADRLTKSGDMRDSRDARQVALDNGIPPKIRGNPLGCSCHEAHLNAVGPVIDGEIEVDYTCGAGWHNYVVFEVRQYASEGEVGLKIDKFGNIVESEGFQAGELGEF